MNEVLRKQTVYPRHLIFNQIVYIDLCRIYWMLKYHVIKS